MHPIVTARYVECANLQTIRMRRFTAMRNNIGTSLILYRIQKRVEESRKFVGNYFYYRKQNHGHAQAWRMAKNTL